MRGLVSQNKAIQMQPIQLQVLINSTHPNSWLRGLLNLKMDELKWPINAGSCRIGTNLWYFVLNEISNVFQRDLK